MATMNAQMLYITTIAGSLAVCAAALAQTDPTASGLYNGEGPEAAKPSIAPIEIKRDIGGFSVRVSRDVFGSLVSADANAFADHRTMLSMGCAEGKFDLTVGSDDYEFHPGDRLAVEILVRGHDARTLQAVAFDRHNFAIRNSAGALMDEISDKPESSLRVLSPAPRPGGNQPAFKFTGAHDAMEAIRRACGKWD